MSDFQALFSFTDVHFPSHTHLTLYVISRRRTLNGMGSDRTERALSGFAIDGGIHTEEKVTSARFQIFMHWAVAPKTGTAQQSSLGVFTGYMWALSFNVSRLNRLRAVVVYSLVAYRAQTDQLEYILLR